MLPTGFYSPVNKNASERVKARVIAVDNGLVQQIGPVKHGSQSLEIRILSGSFKGRELATTNDLMGKLELDKVFNVGDTAFVVLDLTDDHGDITYANVIDHYRLGNTWLLLAAFSLALLAFAGWTGLKALVSFLGSMGGIALTSVLGVVFTHLFKIHGAVRPFTETLLYSGFDFLDLRGLFIAGIFLASSGAVMDLSMDIAAAMHEIVEKHPAITRTALIGSGFTVGRHVVGTMTTTLLLAYSGGYTALMMTFIAQGIPFENIINMIYVSAEMVHTKVGSFGLILVAPVTALVGGVLLKGKAESAAS